MIKYLKYIVSIFINYTLDANRYVKHSKSEFNNKDKSKFIYEIYERVHTIEKGLSSKVFEKGRGKENSDMLIKLVDKYIDLYGSDEHSLYALNVLKFYYTKNSINTALVDCLIKGHKNQGELIKGYREYDNNGISDIKKTHDKFVKLVNFRSSVRSFNKDKKINNDDIEKALKIAYQTPSSCNRQTSDVLLIDDEKDIINLLTFQGGSDTFKNEVPLVLIVTNDISGWDGVHERNQGLIDAGMFSMTLIYALTSLGLATCPLNLAMRRKNENKIREYLKLPGHKRLIMMIAVGDFLSKYKVAESKRMNKTLKIINN